MNKIKKLFSKKTEPAKVKQETPGFLKDPWRKLETEGDWSEQFSVNLLTQINANKVEEDVPYIRILLLGQIRAGKSSYLNSIATIDKGRMSQVTRAGCADSSVTSVLKEYTPYNKLKSFWILDTMGVEESDKCGLNTKDVLFLVKGNISDGYQFNPATSIDEGNRYFRPEPRKREKIHCVTFVVDANIVGQGNITDGARKKIRQLQDELENIDVPRIVILTKIDVLCELVEKHIEDTYRSEKVYQAVQQVQELFQVPEQNIFPVQNYQSEMETDFKKNILHLLAIRQMIYFGTDYINATSAAGKDDE